MLDTTSTINPSRHSTLVSDFDLARRNQQKFSAFQTMEKKPSAMSGHDSSQALTRRVEAFPTISRIDLCKRRGAKIRKVISPISLQMDAQAAACFLTKASKKTGMDLDTPCSKNDAKLSFCRKRPARGQWSADSRSDSSVFLLQNRREVKHRRIDPFYFGHGGSLSAPIANRDHRRWLPAEWIGRRNCFTWPRYNITLLYFSNFF